MNMSFFNFLLPLKQRLVARMGILLCPLILAVSLPAQSAGVKALMEKANREQAMAQAVLEGQTSLDELSKDLATGRKEKGRSTTWSRAQTAASLGHHFRSAQRQLEADAMFALADELIEKSLRSPGQLETNKERAHALATRANLRVRYLNRVKDAQRDVEEAQRLDPGNPSLTKRLRNAVRKTENGKG